MPPVINPNLCDGCADLEYQICVEHCPFDVFKTIKKGQPPLVARPEECWYENACVIDCPRKAIRLRIPLPMHIVVK